MLEIRKLNKSFKNLKIINKVNLNIKDGEIVTIVGSSGSGKTTLLRLISGLEIPDSGEIVLNGRLVNGSKTYIPPEERNCSLVFQDYALFPNMTIKKNIFFGKNSLLDKNKVNNLIEIANIDNIINKYPHQCSGGEQQRTAIVRSLATNPSLLLMDEPMSNLDYELKIKLKLLIVNLLKESKTTGIIVTHDVLDALEMSQKLIILNNGGIIQEGTPNDVYSSPISKSAALLFGETNFIPHELIPEAENCFYDKETDMNYVCVRPEQINIIHKKEDAPNKRTFFGKVISFSKIGSRIRIKLKCNKVDLEISTNSKIDFTIGQKLNVYLDLF